MQDKVLPMKDVAQDMCMHIAHVLRLVDTETSEDVQSSCACARCPSARRAKALHLPRGEHCIGASVESNCGEVMGEEY